MGRHSERLPEDAKEMMPGETGHLGHLCQANRIGEARLDEVPGPPQAPIDLDPGRMAERGQPADLGIEASLQFEKPVEQYVQLLVEPDQRSDALAYGQVDGMEHGGDGVVMRVEVFDQPHRTGPVSLRLVEEYRGGCC